MFKVNIRKARIRCEICLKLTIKTQKLICSLLFELKLVLCKDEILHGKKGDTATRYAKL